MSKNNDETLIVYSMDGSAQAIPVRSGISAGCISTVTDGYWSNSNSLSRGSNDALIVNDRNVMKEIDEMRDALLLITRDFKMEEKYPELKRLKDEYAAALDKYKTFDAIKESK